LSALLWAARARGRTGK